MTTLTVTDVDADDTVNVATNFQPFQQQIDMQQCRNLDARNSDVIVKPKLRRQLPHNFAQTRFRKPSSHK